jgi:hypothetical protein
MGAGALTFAAAAFADGSLGFLLALSPSAKQRLAAPAITKSAISRGQASSTLFLTLRIKLSCCLITIKNLPLSEVFPLKWGGLAICPVDIDIQLQRWTISFVTV